MTCIFFSEQGFARVVETAVLELEREHLKFGWFENVLTAHTGEQGSKTGFVKSGIISVRVGATIK